MTAQRTLTTNELELGSLTASENPAVARLRFESTVPRRLVHRDAVSEVFITDSTAVGENEFVAAAQLPRGHYINENSALYDFLLLVEAGRQAAVVVAHRHLDVPLDAPFIFKFLRLDVLDPSLLRIGSRSANARVSMSVSAERNRAGRLRGFTFSDAMLSIDDKPAVALAGGLIFLMKPAFEALRSRGRAAKLARFRPVASRLLPASPATVARREARNVVISEPTVWGDGKAEASLVVDVGHPHLFDHPLDHVPGNLQLEACRQLAIATVARWHGFDPASLVVLSASVDFDDFGELDLVTRINVEVGEPWFDAGRQVTVVPADLTLRQAGDVVTRARLEVGALQ
jgi:hypothetical protein